MFLLPCLLLHWKWVQVKSAFLTGVLNQKVNYGMISFVWSVVNLDVEIDKKIIKLSKLITSGDSNYFDHNIKNRKNKNYLKWLMMGPKPITIRF